MSCVLLDGVPCDLKSPKGQNIKSKEKQQLSRPSEPDNGKMSLIVSVNFSSAHTGTVNYRAASATHFSTLIMVRVCVPWRREPYLDRSIRAYFSRQRFTFRPQIALKPTPQQYMKLIIPMAGRGTRVRPHSHVTPKPLLPICGKSMVERIIDTFMSVLPRPITDGVFILGPDFGQAVHDELTEICERHEMNAHFGVQDEARGTAHAVACAGDHLAGEGIVVFADTLFYMEPGIDLGSSDVVAWIKEVEDPSRFGVAVREEGRIVAFVEKPAKLISNEALIGIYYVKDLTILRTAIQYLIENDVTGHGNEYQLTDAFDRLLKDGKMFTTATVTAWLDGGTIDAFLETTIDIVGRENHPVPPDSTSQSFIIPPVYIGDGVTISRSVVGPNVAIESGARITDTRISDSIVFSDANVENSVLRGALIGSSSRLSGSPKKINIGDHSEISPA